jgi:putative phage-type endonuclease
MNNIIDPTKVEQGSPEWLQLRLGCVSASTIADVMAKVRGGESATRQKLKLRLAAERLTGQVQESFSSPAMDWGREQEQFAAMAFESERGVFLDKTGWHPHPTIQWLGCSPDRLIDGDALVEIKCPNSSTMVAWMADDKVPTEYIKQIQCQLWITARAEAFFCAYDPRLPKRKQLWIKEVERDVNLIKTMETEVTAFLSEVDQLVKSLEQ